MINRRNFFSKFSLLTFFVPFIPKLKSFLYDKNLEDKFFSTDLYLARSDSKTIIYRLNMNKNNKYLYEAIKLSEIDRKKILDNQLKIS